MFKILADKAYQAFKPIESKAKNLIFGVSDLPSGVKANLEKYGDAKILSATITRTPISSGIQTLMNTLTSSKDIMKKENYDKLFHLGIIFQTDKGTVLFEKNEVINFTDKDLKIKPETEKLSVSVPPNLTINDVFANTERYMTRDKFLKYSAYDNNCQDFIVAVMKSNNIGSDSDIQFVKQNTENIFRYNPNMRKFANTLTDLAARFTGGDVMTGGMVVRPLPYTKEGGSVRRGRGRPRKSDK